MRLKVLFYFLILISFSVFANNSNDTVLQELNAFNDKFNQAVAEKDMAGFLSLYSAEALWIAPASPPVEGHGEPRATLQMIIDNDGQLSHTVDKLIISDDGDQAVMIGSANVYVEKAGIDATGTYLFVLERKNQNWQIITDMWHQHAKQ